MTALVIAEHENAHLRPATFNTITAAAIQNTYYSSSAYRYDATA